MHGSNSFKWMEHGVRSASLKQYNLLRKYKKKELNKVFTKKILSHSQPRH